MQQVFRESQSGWAAKLTVIIGEEMAQDFLRQPGVSFQEGGVEILLFELLTMPVERAKGWVRVRVIVRCFSKVEDALHAGNRIAQALLSFSVTQKVSFSFEENSAGEIVEVVGVQRSLVMEGRAEMRSVWRLDGSQFTELLAGHWRLASNRLTDSERTSLSFYASAEMEVSIEAKFILLMTALEAFCVQQEHPELVEKALAGAAEYLLEILGPDHPVGASLSGQVKQLKRESVARSIKRTLKSVVSNEQLKFVEKAYGYRSKLLHEGSCIPNIHQVSSCLRDVLRLVYSNRFGWELKYPIHLELPH
jgi:hypothetical protein